ncbi:MAG: secondary thiamine-phosphate synthase enzyme YjbQ [Armatimonadota bacterium]|nr:secondary thiamine-phosphate synthase enzyme YjbQ [Armatimonadota bacterium]
MLRMSVRTSKRVEWVDITEEVARCVHQSGAKTGWCVVFVPHTTAGVTINENSDPDVVTDVLAGLERMVPEGETYRHVEGNSPAHIKASLMGSSVTVPIEEGRLCLGTWQAIFFTEFDGPRHRQVFVQVASAP